MAFTRIICTFRLELDLYCRTCHRATDSHGQVTPFLPHEGYFIWNCCVLGFKSDLLFPEVYKSLYNLCSIKSSSTKVELFPPLDLIK